MSSAPPSAIPAQGAGVPVMNRRRVTASPGDERTVGEIWDNTPPLPARNTAENEQPFVLGSWVL